MEELCVFFFLLRGPSTDENVGRTFSNQILVIPQNASTLRGPPGTLCGVLGVHQWWMRCHLGRCDEESAWEVSVAKVGPSWR